MRLPCEDSKSKWDKSKAHRPEGRWAFAGASGASDLPIGLFQQRNWLARIFVWKIDVRWIGGFTAWCRERVGLFREDAATLATFGGLAALDVGDEQGDGLDGQRHPPRPCRGLGEDGGDGGTDQRGMLCHGANHDNAGEAKFNFLARGRRGRYTVRLLTSSQQAGAPLRKRSRSDAVCGAPARQEAGRLRPQEAGRR